VGGTRTSCRCAHTGRERSSMAKRTSKHSRNIVSGGISSNRKATGLPGRAGRAGRAGRGWGLFEHLENRQLMSTVNVADYGARPNDGQDDRSAIQAAIDAAKPGDTVLFGAGQFDINGQVTARSGRTLTGAANNASKLV